MRSKHGIDRDLIRKLVSGLCGRERKMPEAEAGGRGRQCIAATRGEIPDHDIQPGEVLAPDDQERGDGTTPAAQRAAALEQWPMDAEPPNCVTEVDYVNQYVLRRILDKLPKREREVFVRNVVDGVPLMKIAGEMNVSYSTAYRLLDKATVRCKALAGLIQEI